ncbi:MAG: sodium/proline symporter [Candidatus Eisenbacteria sp.]|nr:sodium/proline symporter [Candidatus Eisenbacteria bacterium]
MSGETAGTDWSVAAGLLLYLAVVLVVGIWASRRMKKLDDFVLAGRRLGPLATAISERASGESAWFLLGLPGAAYAAGFTSFWSVIGIAAGIFASWTLLALPLRKATGATGALTLPGYFETRFQDNTHILRGVATIIILVFYTVYVGAQFVGAGKILQATFGMDPAMGMVLGAGIVGFYTLMGGFLAVVWTDVVQGILMMCVAVILPVAGIVHLGGLNGFIAGVSQVDPDFLLMNAGQTGRAFFFGVMLGGLSWGFGYLGQPHLLTRYMAIRNPEHLRQGTAIAMTWVLIAYWGAAMIGLVGLGVLGTGLADAEMVMPLLAKALMPGWIAGLMIAGAIAAMMSTADSQLIVSVSAVVEDVYVQLFHPDASPRRLVVLSRAATIVIAGIALCLAFRNQDLIFNMVAYAWSGLGSSFGPPLLLSLRWKRVRRWGVLAGMLSGMASTIIWKNVAVLNDALDLKLASFLISLAMTVVVSLLIRKESADSSIPPARPSASHSPDPYSAG